MSVALVETRPSTRGAFRDPPPELDAPLAALRQAFGSRPAVFSAASGEMLPVAHDQPVGESPPWSPLARAAAQRHQAELLAEDGGVAVLAAPFSAGGESFAAVVVSATNLRNRTTGHGPAARLLGMSESSVEQWFRTQEPCPLGGLLRLAETALARLRSEQEVRRLNVELDDLSDSLAATYEELSLLYGLTQNLRLSSGERELGRLVIEWLIDCLPAEAVALMLLPTAEIETAEYGARRRPILLTTGGCSLDSADLLAVVESVRMGAGSDAFVANRGVTAADDWPLPEVRQVILVPLNEGDNLFGWLAAVNHEEDAEFGSAEAGLLKTVGTILGTHCGNHEHYREQSALLASVVRALTSAIDAKDPYTCGHSERVARISMLLARQLGHPEEALDTIYMAGLLHDIGKIGIDDQVLRKPGRLSEAEFEHIKLHPQLGHRILQDIKQLADTLPVVLHHHEQWDGGGYPLGLAAEGIPPLARIAAVADAYDAMSSDRPYRKGLPEEKVDEIFRAGAGQQWDPRVVEAFFTLREEIAQITRGDRTPEPSDALQLT